MLHDLLLAEHKIVSQVASPTMIVAADAFGTVRSSPDGIVWTTRNSILGSSPIQKVFFANGLFVAIGNNFISTSPDGINWTARTSNIPTGQLYEIVYTGAFFLAITLQGSVILSNDGITWSPVTTVGLPANGLNVLAYGAGIIIIGTTIGKLYSSTDGINWTLRLDIGISSYVTGLIYDGTRFVAVCGTLLKISADGITWTAGANIPISGPKLRFTNNKYFLYTNAYWESIDLVSWSGARSVSGYDIRDIVFFKDNYYFATLYYVYRATPTFSALTSIGSTSISNFHNSVATN